jgi:hypothetical protein
VAELYLDADDPLTAHREVTRDLARLRVALGRVKFQQHQTRTQAWVAQHQGGQRTDAAKSKLADASTLDWSRQVHDLTAEIEQLEDVRRHLELRIQTDQSDRPRGE